MTQILTMLRKHLPGSKLLYFRGGQNVQIAEYLHSGQHLILTFNREYQAIVFFQYLDHTFLIAKEEGQYFVIEHTTNATVLGFNKRPISYNDLDKALEEAAKVFKDQGYRINHAIGLSLSKHPRITYTTLFICGLT